jgi:hypothetical protein
MVQNQSKQSIRTRSDHTDYSSGDEFMEPASFFSALESVNEKPRPFSVYTASELWTDEHHGERALDRRAYV